jgi:hypothetical protein
MATNLPQKDISQLTSGQLKLLEVLSNPEHYNKPVNEKCNLAGISRKTYYKYLKDENFRNAVNEIFKEILVGAKIPLLRQAIKAGLGKSHPDRKMCLEMSGDYNPKITHEGEIDHTIIFKNKEDAKEF